MAPTKSRFASKRGKTFKSKGSKPYGKKGSGERYPVKGSNSKGKRRAALTVSSASANGLTKLTKCARKMAAAAADPFSTMALGACVPIFPARDSQKRHGNIRATFTTTTTNHFGWVAFAPTLACDVDCCYTNGSTTTYDNGIKCTGALSTDVHSHKMTDMGPGVASLLGGSLLTASSVTGRIVASGLRVRYVGREDARSGSIIMFCDDQHSTVENLKHDNLQQLKYSVSFPVSREWTSINVIPGTPDEMNYAKLRPGIANDGDEEKRHVSFPLCENAVNTKGAQGAPIMGCYVYGCAAQTFEFEIITHAEYIGSGVRSVSTPNEVDSKGIEVVQEAFHESRQKRQSHRNPSKVFVQELAKSVYKGKKTEGAVANLLSGGWWGRKGILWPGYNYLGPGNEIDGVSPVSSLDEVALDHDMAYGTATSPAQVNAADLRFVGEAYNKDFPVGLIASAAIGSKYAIEKMTNMNFYGV